MTGRGMMSRRILLTALSSVVLGSPALANPGAGFAPATTPDRIRALAECGESFTARAAARQLLDAAEASGDSGRVAEALECYLAATESPGATPPADRRSFAERLARLREAQPRADSAALASSLLLFGRALREANQSALARAQLERALSIRERLDGRAPPEPARIQFEIGLSLLAAKDTTTAGAMIEKAVSTWRRSGEADSLWLAWPLLTLAQIVQARGDAEDARSLGGQALALLEANVSRLERSLGPEAPCLSEALRLHAVGLRNLGRDLGRADSLVRRALLLREKALGTHDPELIGLLDDLARSRNAQQDYKGAAQAYGRELAIQMSVTPADSVEITATLSRLGWAFFQSRDYPRAAAQYESARAIQEARLPADSPDLAFTLHRLAWSLQSSGEYEQALRYYRRALAIREKVLAPDDVNLGWTLNNLGMVLTGMGEFEEARLQLERALPILEKALGPTNPEFAKPLYNLGSLDRSLGDYNTARDLEEKALAIREKAWGPDSPDLAPSLAALGWTMWLLQDFAAADSFFARAIRNIERTRGPDDPGLCTPLEGLATSVAARGRTRESLAYEERAIAIMEKSKSREIGPHRAIFYNYAGTLSDLGEWRKAHEIYGQVLGFDRKGIGPESWYVGADLLALALTERMLGDLRGARADADSGMRIMERALGPEHPWVVNCTPEYVDVLVACGDTSAAFAAALRAEGSQRRHVENTAHGLSEREALLLATSSTTSQTSDWVLSLAGGGVRPRERRDAWSSLIESRALVLDEVARRHRAATDISRQARDLAEASQALSNLTVRGPGRDDPERYRARFQEALARRESAERALAATSYDFREELSGRGAGLDRVALRLPAGSAIAAFARYNHFTVNPAQAADRPQSLEDTTSSYLAFVMRAGDRDPAVIRLGEAAGVDSLVGIWRHQVSQGARVPERFLRESSCRAAGEALRRVVWDPLLAAIGSSSRVFIVPDGSLQMVNFAALPADSGRYLLETGPLIHYLATERDLLSPLDPPRAGTGLLALGGADFDHVASGRGSAHVSSGPVASGADAAAQDRALRGARPDCDAFRSMRWDPLPGTARECEDVAALWRGSDSLSVRRGGREDVLLLTGPRATEHEFKARAAGHRVLHLATHGFFMQDVCGPRDVSGKSRLGSPDGTATPDLEAGADPLTLSGLALAGANERSVAGPGEDDGVLTAEEVGTLDLSGVEWAVLSACNTGVGEVTAGEGVLGLRRAFQIAGVRTLIMSLWPVSDESTRGWMRALYEARLRRRLSTAESVREASLSILRTRRARGLDTHPFHWGAFIATGDWQ